jgi:uncharacterized membrane protein YfcA
MEIVGYLAAALIGISLGLLGSGGSILTVPIMVYLMGISPVDATGYSLFVVGVTSAVGGSTYIKRKLVNFNTAVVFAIPSVISVFLARKYLLTAVPDIIISKESFVLTKDILLLILFSVLMIIVAIRMISSPNVIESESAENQYPNFPLLIFIGAICGILTGILGVGGGFIIIPALVLFAKVKIRESVGTSLLIIAFNCLSGFIGEMLERHSMINYYFLFLFSALSLAGIFIGFRISMKLHADQIKKVFGWFILIMGIAVFIKEVFFQLL